MKNDAVLVDLERAKLHRDHRDGAVQKSQNIEEAAGNFLSDNDCSMLPT